MTLEIARSFFKDGNVLQAIFAYRELLRQNHSRLDSCRIYIELARIYRIQGQMNNAQLEIQRAFKAVQIPWPRNSLFSLVIGFIRQRQVLLDGAILGLNETQTSNLLAELFVELGLSSYYLRQTFRMILCSVYSRRACLRSGDTMAKLNWYGATACVFALLRIRKLASQYVETAKFVSKKINAPESLGKAAIWSALVTDYLGDPIQSAKIFSELIDNFGSQLDANDLRLACVTLSINLLTRGHFREAQTAIEKMGKLQRCFADSQSFGRVSSVGWYAIPSHAYLGSPNKILEQTALAKSVLATNNNEKWIVAQFLGCLVIANYWLGVFASEEVDDFVDRFENLGMHPSNTHFEACFYWIGKSYSLSRRVATPIVTNKLLKSLKDLKSLPLHPTNQSHRLALELKTIHQHQPPNQFFKLCRKAEAAAQECNNVWALFEIWTVELERHYQIGTKGMRVSELHSQIEKLTSNQGWVLDRSRAKNIQSVAS